MVTFMARSPTNDDSPASAATRRVANRRATRVRFPSVTRTTPRPAANAWADLLVDVDIARNG